MVKQNSKHEEEKDFLEGSSNTNLSYFDRCKEVGRVGPPKTELDMNSVYGEFETLEERVLKNASPLGKALVGDRQLVLDVTAKSNFASIRANTAVTKECYYYEVTLLSDGLM